mgnify:CR=1 FL=1
MEELLREHVGTQYHDYKGHIEVDTHGGTEIFKLCEDNGIDMEQFFVIGFGLSEFTTQGIGKQDQVGLKILLADKEQYGQSFDEIEQQVSSDGGKIVVTKKTIYIPYSTLGKYIKRFDFLVVNHMRDNLTEIEIDEED